MDFGQQPMSAPCKVCGDALDQAQADGLFRCQACDAVVHERCADETSLHTVVYWPPEPPRRQEPEHLRLKWRCKACAAAGVDLTPDERKQRDERRSEARQWMDERDQIEATTPEFVKARTPTDTQTFVYATVPVERNWLGREKPRELPPPPVPGAVARLVDSSAVAAVKGWQLPGSARRTKSDSAGPGHGTTQTTVDLTAFLLPTGEVALFASSGGQGLPAFDELVSSPATLTHRGWEAKALVSFFTSD